MVVCTSGSVLKNKLSAQWEYMMEMEVCTSPFFPPHKTALLIRSQEQPHMPSHDPPSQHHIVLSDFADKHKCSIILRGPLVGRRVLQSLTHLAWPHLTGLALIDLCQLGAEIVSHLSDSWHTVTDINISDSLLDASLMLKMGTGWPLLHTLGLSNNQLDANAVWALTQVKWPNLRAVSLNFNKLGVEGMQHLVSRPWPFPQVVDP